MTPEQAREAFSAAFDDELGADERAEFEAALAADPELRRDYAQFAQLLELAHSAATAGPAPGPDLLSGVQRRLRTRSRGRFYGDRFAERAGVARLTPVWVGLLMLLLLGLAWGALQVLGGVELSPSQPAAPAAAPE